ncbi:unnamed protein product [Closterium sp. NIES-65]|nr:unnamed protein product [Closterium sp. NIES-65]
MARVAYPRVTSGSRDLDNIHGLVEGMDTKLASLEQKQDIATRGVLLLCSFVSRGLQGNPGNQELLKGRADMSQMAVPQGLADMSQMAVPQLAAGKGAPAGGAVGLSGLKELEFISSALESSVHHTGKGAGGSGASGEGWEVLMLLLGGGGGWGVREAVGLSGLKELEFLSSALESSPWCTTQVGSTDVTAWRGGGWGVREAVGLSGLKELEFLPTALESSVHLSSGGVGVLLVKLLVVVLLWVGQWGSGAVGPFLCRG